MNHLGDYDVIVIGAGHAGIEAAHAAAVLGAKTAVFTMSLDAIGNMPCNPSIGGTAKGTLVREVDALGGVMGLAADATYLQSRMLNKGKGPAVHALRVQTDRRRYNEYMKHALEQTPGLAIHQAEVVGTKPSDKYEPGQIVEQDPAGGRSRKNNLVIKVYLCAEEDGTLMPNVVGSEFLQAKTELNKLHLDLDIQRADAYSPDVPEGQVMESSPASGEQLKKGDTVVLTVSKGPETKPLTVPSFVTMTIDDAAAQAEAMGLKVGEHQYEYSDKPEGTVIGQSIEQGTEVQSGTEIVFTVSKGSSSAERVVVFDIPDQYRSDSNLKIEVMQDGSIIHSTYVDGSTTSFTYTFRGSQGSTSTIKLYINGTEAVSQEIVF